MRAIRIINGVYGYRPAGSTFVDPKRAGDPPFEIDAEKAARLVALKVAEYADVVENVPFGGVATGFVGYKTDKVGVNPPGDSDPPEDEFEDELDVQEELDSLEKPYYGTDMKMDELREIMDECDIPFRVGMSKEDVVALLDEYFNDVEDPENQEDFLDFTHEDVVP